MNGFLEPKDFVRDPAARDRVWTPAESLQYTRWLATHHYENFHVVSFLLPKHLHHLIQKLDDNSLVQCEP